MAFLICSNYTIFSSSGFGHFWFIDHQLSIYLVLFGISSSWYHWFFLHKPSFHLWWIGFSRLMICCCRCFWATFVRRDICFFGFGLQIYFPFNYWVFCFGCIWFYFRWNEVGVDEIGVDEAW